nr:uncharacterized protein LOC129281842 isoform X2 [Lytechinus pictus]
MEAVAERLRDWGFADLIEVFGANRVDDEAFHLLEKDTMKELIPAVGRRVKFEQAFKAYRQTDKQNTAEAREKQDGPVAPERAPETEDEVTPMSTSEDEEPEDVIPPPKRFQRCKFDICGILRKIPNKSGFLEQLEGKRTATYCDRRVICHALVAHLMEHHGSKLSRIFR